MQSFKHANPGALFDDYKKWSQIHQNDKMSDGENEIEMKEKLSERVLMKLWNVLYYFN